MSESVFDWDELLELDGIDLDYLSHDDAKSVISQRVTRAYEAAHSMADEVIEQQATIETLRRRVRELEEKNYQLKATRGSLIDAFTCVEYAFGAITAENAELKRQVEALREDAEVGRLAKKLSCIEPDVMAPQDYSTLEISFCQYEATPYGVSLNGSMACIEGATLLEALKVLESLREAAKGEVE